MSRKKRTEQPKPDKYAIRNYDGAQWSGSFEDFDKLNKKDYTEISKMEYDVLTKFRNRKTI